MDNVIHYKGFNKIINDDEYYLINLDNEKITIHTRKAIKEVIKSINLQVIKDNPQQLFYL
jgi:hypothetical protein